MRNRCFDIAIIGTGIAAHALLEEITSRSTMRVALVLGGDATVANEQYDVVSGNHYPLDECANANFGGTSKTWGGRCVDYNTVDFVTRDYLQVSWPINKTDLIPYYNSACEFLNIGTPSFDYSAKDSLNDHGVTHDSSNNNTTFSMTTAERWSLPLRCHRNRKVIDNLPNVTIFDDFHVSDIKKYEDGYELLSSYSRQDSILCTRCVVAAGGLGSTKILLNSLNVDDYSALGKYYQGHLSGKIANVVFSNPDSVDCAFRLDNGVYTRWRFQPTSKTILKHQLLNTALWIDNLPISNHSHGNAILSFTYLMLSLPLLSKVLVPPSVRKALLGRSRGDIWKHLVNVLRAPLSILLFAPPFFCRRFLSKRKLPGIFLFSSSGKYAVHFHAEQQPVESNCVRKKKASLGFDIQYEFTDFDCESALKNHELLDTFLRDNELGYLEYYSSNKDELIHMMRSQCVDGIHQAGLTRMSASQKTGVVDSDLQVFQQKNLFVLSSSVFPTSSQANPTFLLTVMAKRLASHVLSEFQECRTDG